MTRSRYLLKMILLFLIFSFFVGCMKPTQEVEQISIINNVGGLLRVSESKEFLAIADQSLWIIDIERRKIICKTNFGEAKVLALEWKADDSVLFVGTNFEQIYIIDPANCDEQNRIQVSPKFFGSRTPPGIPFSLLAPEKGSDKILVAGLASGEIQFLDYERKLIYKSIPGEGDGDRFIWLSEVNENKSNVISVSSEGNIYTWNEDLTSKTSVANLKNFIIDVSMEEDYLALIGYENHNNNYQIFLFQLSTGILKEIMLSDLGELTAIEWIPSCDILVLGNDIGNIIFMNQNFELSKMLDVGSEILDIQNNISENLIFISQSDNLQILKISEGFCQK